MESAGYSSTGEVVARRRVGRVVKENNAVGNNCTMVKRRRKAPDTRGAPHDKDSHHWPAGGEGSARHWDTIQGHGASCASQRCWR